jgi:hypothetical protein
MKKHKAALVAAALVVTGAAQAADTGVGARFGTTGFGLDFGYGLTDSLTGRIGYSGFSYSRDFSETDITYDGSVKLSNFSALLDWRFAGQWRVTGGLVSAKNTADVVGQPTGGTFTINDVTYNASQIGTLSGNVRLGKSVTPYLGIGYGDITRKGFGFFMDLGIMFQGSPTVDLNASCGAISAADCNRLQSDIAAEEAQLREDLKDFKYFPVLNFGISYGW